MTDRLPDKDRANPLPAETVTRETVPLSHSLPDRIGRYHIKRVIASGGMGTVYEATQDNPRRVVAVKVMKQGIASKSALRRFEYEGQILGRLRHPGIAQIYEAGTHTDTSRDRKGAESLSVPYFAMEYIPNAKPITKYAGEKKLGTRQRMELFAKVCDAIHHGHQKGIIHRDLKPSNILVDSTGQVKIIDFGVARCTDSDLAVTTLQTDVGQLIGTLQYMSPEQCEGDPHDIDTRSDVYALGVVFYQLLSGSLPYDVTRMAMHQATRAIREQHPTKLSTLNHTLRGDVETIALKALEKERERRYQSAADLGHDIHRYLTGEAILARRASIVYQLRLFARRNKAVFASLAAVFVILLTGVVVSTSLYLRAETARQRAILAEQDQSRERERAESKAAEAEAVTDFLSDMLASANPWKSGKDVMVRQVLDEASKTIATKFADQPLLEARLRGTMGVSYLALGLYEEVESHLKRALEIHRGQLGPENPETIRSKFRLADFYVGRDTPYAKSICDQALAEARRSLGEEHEITLRLVSLQSRLAQQAGRNGEAMTHAQRVLDVRRRVLGDEHPDTLRAMHRVADLYRSALERPADAAELDERVVAVRRRLLGAEHPDTVDSMDVLAGSYRALHRFEDAAKLDEAVLAVRRRALGEDHPLTSLSMRKLAIDYMRLGRCSEAFALFEQAAESFRRTFGEAHPDTLYASNELAWALLTCEPPEFRDPPAALRVAQRVCSEAAIAGNRAPFLYLDTLALAQHMTGDPVSAVGTQQRAITLLPTGVSATLRMGFEQRLAEYEAALAAQAARDATPP